MSRAPARSGRATDDAGQVGGIEVLPFGLLVFVVGALLVTNAWAVIDAKSTVDRAARAGVRAYVEAPDEHGGAVEARRAATDVLAGSTRAEGAVIRTEASMGFARCAPVSVVVTTRVPTLHLPWIGGLGDGFDVTARHTELVDPHRSGLPGASRC